jgi:hypothetical protein
MIIQNTNIDDVKVMISEMGGLVTSIPSIEIL